MGRIPMPKMSGTGVPPVNPMNQEEQKHGQDTHATMAEEIN